MDCKEFDKKIPLFIANELSYSDLKKFLEHVDTCPECREELTIQVLIAEGMARLEDGNALDLKEEIDNRMQEARGRVSRHKTLRIVQIVLIVAAFLSIGLVAALFLL